MARRHYLITYDISNDKRRDKVFQTLRDNGDHTQFSVFLCQLSESELAGLKAALIPLTNRSEDQILIIDLGVAERTEELEIQAIGRVFSPPLRTMIV